ncbi:Hypp7171 [Branchiostoma lanceolatum]|uniref:Hypp7171 protein n=1 Tax=Branchiostoma lanceolatum TaxID=7740 RepID=A0A8J9YY14_BRALA|nr:Hypp7171 [Branchiostoma lanceolatum]
MADVPMSDRHRDVIRKKYIPLSRDLKSQHVLNCLYQEKVLTEEMMEDLAAIPDQRRGYKARKLLDLIMTRGDRAFGVFKQALEESGYRHLAELLEEPPLPKPLVESGQHRNKDSPGVASEEVPEGPLKSLRLSLQPYKETPSAQKIIEGCRLMEAGAELLNNSGYTDTEGLKKVVEGFVVQERLTARSYERFLYSPDHLGLDRTRLTKLITTQLHHNPTDSTCLFLQAALLPFDDTRVQEMRKVVDVIVENGEEDPLHKYLHHVYCVLGDSLLNLYRDSPSCALPAFTTALMYKRDYPTAIHLAAECSMVLSPQDAVEQFQRYLQLAPPHDKRVHWAHYFLAILYSRQSEPEKAEEHYRLAVEAEDKRLPTSVTGWAKEVAQKVFA